MTRINSWFTYAGAGLLLTVLVAVIASAMSGQAQAIWAAAGIAYVIQLVAFGLLLALRPQPQLFLIAWLSGMVLRFGVVGACAFWLSRTGTLPMAATMISLVGFVFLLLLLEPVFLRWDLRERAGNREHGIENS